MSFPTFPEFARALHGDREPFPWQTRLAELVTEAGWPTEIGVPTGLGKTTCIDIAVWAAAAEAQRAPAERVHPTRIWYVVNRRLLVDAAHDHAVRLQAALGQASSSASALGAVADALKSRSGFSGESSNGSGLSVSRLRGGTEIGARPPHPAQVALILSTVPMFASSWLFRGYASSRSMSPVDAAHAGIDSLVLLDEAHLSRPLLELAPKLAACDIGDARNVLVPPSRSRPVIVSLSATGSATDPFELDHDDHGNAVVTQRLDAAKILEVRPVDTSEKKLAKSIVDSVIELTGAAVDPPSLCVFVNQPDRARDVLTEMRKSKTFIALGEPELVVLTGRMRRREAEAARERLLDPATGVKAGADRQTRERPLITVATQTLEVGADLDFDLMVTESCGARALVQRLGRLNRMGTHPEGKAVMVHPTRDKSRAVYAEEPAELFERLQELAGFEGVIDVSPRSVTHAIGPPRDAPPRTGEILPAHLWEYAKTTTPPPGEAPVELFFDGFDDHSPKVSVCWRRHIPDDNERLIPSVSPDESVDLPLWELRAALETRGDQKLVVLSEDRVTVTHCLPPALRAGMVVVLRSDDGLYDEHGWGAPLDQLVEDDSLARWPGLLLDDTFLRHWLHLVPNEVAELRDACADEDVNDDLERLAHSAVTALRSCEPLHSIDQWHDLTRRLTSEAAQLGTASIMLVAERTVQRRESDIVAADSLDDLCANATSAALSDHLDTVGSVARSIAEALGLAPALVEACSEAGRFHDIGKADGRFQRWLSPSDPPSDPLAKSSVPRWRWRRTRLTSGWPEGGRHEELSGRLLKEWLDHLDDTPEWDPDLVLHLVLSHHGYGRPLLNPLREDPSATTVTWEIDGTKATVSASLSDTDWGQPARFRRCCERYGYWGVALLEAVVRQADHAASGVVVA